MAAEVKSLPPYRPPPGPSPITADQRYWQTFKSHQLLPSPSSTPVTSIYHSFPQSPGPAAYTSSSDPHLIAATTGPRIHLYTTRGTPYPKLLRTITTRLSDPTAAARSAVLRRDARVLAAGSDTGALQVYDTSSRAILKTWNQHKQPVWATRWSPHQGELTQLMSCSDDRTVRTWELSENDPTNTFHGHQDYVRTGAYMPHTPSVLVSGSYDGTVRLWDARAPDGQSKSASRAVMTFALPAPVESVLPLPTGAGTTLLASAGSSVSVLDLVAGRSVTTLKAHQKTVTALCTASNHTRVLTGALDGHLKIWDTNTWTVVAGRKYDAQVLSVSVVPAPPSASTSTTSDPTDRHLLVGLSSGVLSIRTRLSGATKTRQKARFAELAALAAGTIEDHDRKVAKKRKLTQGHRARLRGVDYDGFGAELVVEGNTQRGEGKKRKLQAWDQLLRKLEYGGALEAALSSGDQAIVITVLKACVHRSALPTAVRALADRGQLGKLVRWARLHVCDARDVGLVTRVGMLAAGVWAEGLGVRESKGEVEWKGEEKRGMVEGERAILGLHRAVREQVDVCHEAGKTLGMLDLLLVEAG